MAAAPEREDFPRPRPALDLTVSSGNTTISLKIDDSQLARHALTGIGIGCGVAAGIGIGCGVALAVLFYRQPELVTSAVTQALEGPGLRVGNIAPGSILVELNCETKESFLSFIKDFEKGKVKQRLKEEFAKIGYKGELEVTISNDKEVNKKLHQIRLTYTYAGSEFVKVPTDLKGRVIGKGGCIVREIMDTSGAKVISRRREEEGFIVSGNKEQRACAKRLIFEKVRRNSEEASSAGHELIEVPKEFKGLVFGKGGQNLKNISNQTGAEVIRKNGEVYITSGTEKQREQAKVRIKERIAGARLGGEINKCCVYIDGWNLPENCKLKLDQVERGDTIVLPDSRTQYRLKPAEDYDQQETRSAGVDPPYLSNLENDVLECLRKIKQDMKAGEKPDMWCHFGKAVIRGPDKDEAENGRWTIDEATTKFILSAEGTGWRTAAFKEGVKFDEQILKAHVLDTNPEEYVDSGAARYDLAFLTPCSNQLILKVWVTERNMGKKLEDIPVPLGDVKNTLDEIHFEDEVTQSRCRGWLVVPTRKYLRADILFPQCEFDCRLFIRGRTDSALITDYVPKEETCQVLKSYLSKLTLTSTDSIGLSLPEGKIPEGFHLFYKRCSKRFMYEISPGFTVKLSKESSWRSDAETEEPRESTDFHLHCREWDDLLNSEDWEPEKIIEKLPEFVRFVKKVQGIVWERTVPPEILARGLVAVEAYNKALSDGMTFVKRVPIMLIGQDRAGKTSLKKSLKGICFDPEEDSTVGIDVDPSHFEVSTETWKTGEMDLNQDSDAAIAADYRTAKFIVDSVKEKRKNTKSETDTGKSAGSFDPELTKMLAVSMPAEPPKEPEHSQTPRDAAPSLSRHVPRVPPDPTERNKKDLNFSYPDVPDEVAAVTETLLQGNTEDNDEVIYSTLWDFAGQSVYYVTHPLFLSKKAIYFLVYDLSLDPNDVAKPVVKQGVYDDIEDNFHLRTNLDYLDFWMTSVASLAHGQDEGCRSGKKELPPVFLVGTHADILDGRDAAKKRARRIFGFLKHKPYGAHLYDVFFVDNTSLSVNNSDCPEVMRLRQKARALAKDLPYINEAIPIKWLNFEKELQAEKKKLKRNKCISLESAKDIASKVCKIDDDKEFETLMNYLHDLRSLIHFDDTAVLNELVVLDPQWLVDVFKKVITIKPYDHEEEKFEDQWCKLEREGILNEELLLHMWDPLFDSKETYQNLIGIMEKFSLMCPWPSDSSSSKSYLVPSMLKSHPPEEALKLVKSAKIPSLFVKFTNGQVPPDLFSRLVVQFFQWGKDKFCVPDLFHDFARFFTSTGDGYSVILICHSSTVEVVVYGGDHKAGVTCASVVRRQLDLMLEHMHNESRWQRDMRYEMSFRCPVCSEGGIVKYCRTHGAERCKEEQCLHFWTESKLVSVLKETVSCTKAPFAGNSEVQIKQFSPWFASPEQQELYPSTSTGTTEQAPVQGDSKNSAKALNVTLLASEWGSSMGGLSTLNRELAILLAKNTRVNVTFFVPPDVCREEDKRTAVEHNIAILEAKHRPGYDDDDPLVLLSFPPKDLTIDIVLGHGAKLGKQAQIITESHGCKWAQVVHTAPEELGMHKHYPSPIAKGEKKNRTEVDLCKLADLVVTIGPKLKEDYSSHLRSCEKHHDIIELTPGTFHEFTKVKQAPQDERKFKVLIFGRGDLEDFSLKGYDIAAKAVVELNDSSYRLVFVGAPSGKEEEVKDNLLKCGISEDQLIVRGFVQGKERIKELFYEVDLAIMPSRTEGFGLTALEALSAGLPILVSGNSGFAQALRNLPSGESFVVESKDPKVWAKAIALVRQKERSQRLQEIQTLRASYEERYSWEVQCEALVEKLQSMALK